MNPSIHFQCPLPPAPWPTGYSVFQLNLLFWNQSVSWFVAVLQKREASCFVKKNPQTKKERSFPPPLNSFVQHETILAFEIELKRFWLNTIKAITPLRTV